MGTKLIKHLLFDLDNTLYPASAVINTKITERMLDYVAKFLNLPLQEAIIKRKENVSKYGTTLEWLRTDCGLNQAQTEEFFAYVHPESEVNEVPFDQNLRPFLLSIDLPKTVLTNAPFEHAERILKMLNVFDLFENVVDLRANNLQGKPHKSAYENAVKKSGFTITDSLFIDDHTKYTNSYLALGGKAILVDQDDKIKNCPCPKIKTIYELKDFI